MYFVIFFIFVRLCIGLALLVFHTSDTDKIDHDLDDLDPNLPFRGAVQDKKKYSAAPSDETCARSPQIVRLPPGSASLIIGTDQRPIFYKILNHQVGIDDLSDA